MRPHQHVSELSGSNLRVSDADRQQVIDALTGHTAVGRLTLDEFSARVGAVTRAKTYRELAAVTADLPITTSAASGSASATRRALLLHPAGAVVAALVVILVVLLAGTVLATAAGASGMHSMMASMTAAMGCG